MASAKQAPSIYNQAVEDSYRSLVDQLNYANDTGDTDAFLLVELKLREFIAWLAE